MTPKRIWYSILSSLILLEILSLATMNSWNPLAVLSHQSLILRILGWYLIVQSGLAFLGMLQMMYVIGDKPCPICNKSLAVFIPVYGNPVMCKRCRTWFHKNCLMAKKDRCPICYPDMDQGPDIPLDFTRRFPGQF